MEKSRDFVYICYIVLLWYEVGSLENGYLGDEGIFGILFLVDGGIFLLKDCGRDVQYRVCGVP